MFEIGFWELVMVGVVALVVVGPERLPGLARTAGLWLGKARRMLAEVKAEVDRELQLEELKQSFRQQVNQSGVQDLADRARALHHDIQAEFDDPGPPPGWRPGDPATQSPDSGAEPFPSNRPVGLPEPVSLQKSTPAPVASPTVAPTPSLPSSNQSS